MAIKENEYRGSVGINGPLPEETNLPKWAKKLSSSAIE